MTLALMPLAGAMADAVMAQEVFCTLQIGRNKVGRMTYRLKSDGWHYEPRFSLGVAALRAYGEARLSTRKVKAASLAAKIIQERTLKDLRFSSLRAAERRLGNLARLAPGALSPEIGYVHVS